VTGPEHYKQAEKILGGLDTVRDQLTAGKPTTADVNAGIAIINGLIAEAQIHATLAVAAATAEAGDLVRWDEKSGPTEWQQVIYP
jgi:hypothetical protein